MVIATEIKFIIKEESLPPGQAAETDLQPAQYEIAELANNEMIEIPYFRFMRLISTQLYVNEVLTTTHYKVL